MAITICRQENELILYKVFLYLRVQQVLFTCTFILSRFYMLFRLVCKILRVEIYINICTLVYMLYTICCLHLFSYLDRMIGILYIINPVQPMQLFIFMRRLYFYYNLNV